MAEQSASEKVAAFFSNYPLRTYPEGQILIHAGDQPQAILYIASGKVRQYDISYRGDDVVVNIFKEGAFLPMLWAMTEAENRYFFAAETELQVHMAPKDDVVAFMHENPDVVYDLLTRLYRGLDGLLGRLSHLMAGSAKSRLMYELLIESRRFGKRADDGTVSLSITEADLAARAGLSRETVSRELQKIRRDGLVSIDRASIVIASVEGLEQKLGTEL
ncbi:MAG TPA: Crp/Fnr family transcriptional regulator [Candidatus Saccharimonadales bacterium]|nr:Crp/Fnr family transcriptional regulator [Candidatus Saccharimonadales bacterium]